MNEDAKMYANLLLAAAHASAVAHDDYKLGVDDFTLAKDAGRIGLLTGICKIQNGRLFVLYVFHHRGTPSRAWVRCDGKVPLYIRSIDMALDGTEDITEWKKKVLASFFPEG